MERLWWSGGTLFFLNFKHTVVLLLCHVTLPAENCVYRSCTQELR